MDARELLARLAPKGVDLASAGGRSIDALTPNDIAAAIGLANISELQSNLLRVRYVGDSTCWETLRRDWFLHCVSLGTDYHWKVEYGKSLYMLLSLASLLEHVQARTCRACQGVAHLLIDNVLKACPFCRGAGRKGLSDRKLAKIAGVTREVWGNTYSGYLRICASELQTLDDQAIARIKGRIGK